MEPFDLKKWAYFKETGVSCNTPTIIDQVAIDSRRISSKHALFVALTGAHFDGHAFVKQAAKAGARFAIVRHDVELTDVPSTITLLKVANPLRALQQIAASYRKERSAKVIAITGSYGKTMLKDLLEQLIGTTITTFASPESFNSQLGVALSLLKLNETHKIALIEAGISKPDEMAHHIEMIRPDHAILTNIGAAHIGSLGTQDAIIQEKLRLLAAVDAHNWKLLPKQFAHHIKESTRYFWDEDHAHLPRLKTKESEAGRKFSHCYEIAFPSGATYQGEISDGLSYVVDLITIAVKAAHLVGIDEKTIATGLQTYFPEPMRIELWKSPHGATIINDTYCADPMSCDTALTQFESIESSSREFHGRKIFLFGGLRSKSDQPESDMQRIAHAIAKHKVDLAIISEKEHQKALISCLSMISPNTEVKVAKNEKDALEIAKSELESNDVLIIKGAKKQSVYDLIQEFEESLPNNQVIINLAAIQSNIEMIRSKIGNTTRIMVMVKALAYGTDDIRIAKFLKTAGVDILGVSYVDEGVSMRKSGVTQDIFVLNAAEYEAAKAVKWGLEIGVSEPILILAIQKEAAKQNKTIKVHLHVDTGMGRFGCKTIDVPPLATLIHNCPNLTFEGIMTHFACADNPNEDAFTLSQAATLQNAIDTLGALGIHPRWKHAANSSAALRISFPHFNMIRIGLAAYGLHTSKATHGLIDLRPAISLVSRIVGINQCYKGDTISYGRTYTVSKESARIAVLPIGYFDGLHRNYSDKGYVMIRGKMAPMVGRICMDYMMCDISDIPLASIGDPVLIFGEDENGQYLSPETLATSGGSIVHELMTCLGPRIRRLFIYDESLRPR